ncbi:putative mannan polymerase complex subunit Mnn9p [[Candida] railenensis]|uniref:Mannan polymerase complex subunit Mnn9p n=1 Tax=[Candida] railenensis TaxID=45579 RepID=A0A9P0QM85_9ASCO|nr:putative mannan polymerase complex subunit Mnn9p [[Candida] railenensis]
MPLKKSPIASLGAALVVFVLFWVTLFIPSDVYSTVKSQSYGDYAPLENTSSNKVTVASEEESLKSHSDQISFTRQYYHNPDDDYTKISFTNQKTVIDSEQEQKTLLILSSIVDDTAYGEHRTFDDFFNNIFSFNYARNVVSLGILIGSEKEFKIVDEYFQKYFSLLNDLSTSNDVHKKIIKKFVNKVTLITAPFIERGFEIERGDRHEDSVQRQRRRTIARSRNFILMNSLRDERYTLFLDSDIIDIKQKDMINIFIESGKDIIVPRVIMDWNNDYDKNSWRGERTVPNEEQLEKMDKNDWDNFHYVPNNIGDKMYHLSHSLLLDDPETNDLKYSVPLDSVGGAILFSKSVIFRQGIVFPTFYLIGTTWNRFEGYDGIETEGLCYSARTLGYSCWGYPNMVAEHVRGS